MLYGAACSTFIEPSGGGAAPREEVAIRFGANGDPILYAMSGASGQGHETVFPEIVAKVLGVDPESISLRASDPLGPALVGLGTIGSRSMMTHGGAFTFAARAVRRACIASPGPIFPSASRNWRASFPAQTAICWIRSKAIR
jgi:carbon-monoxide dehydrogenase large subunit